MDLFFWLTGIVLASYLVNEIQSLVAPLSLIPRISHSSFLSPLVCISRKKRGNSYVLIRNLSATLDPTARVRVLSRTLRGEYSRSRTFQFSSVIVQPGHLCAAKMTAWMKRTTHLFSFY